MKRWALLSAVVSTSSKRKKHHSPTNAGEIFKRAKKTERRLRRANVPLQQANNIRGDILYPFDGLAWSDLGRVWREEARNGLAGRFGFLCSLGLSEVDSHIVVAKEPNAQLHRRHRTGTSLHLI